MSSYLGFTLYNPFDCPSLLTSVVSVTAQQLRLRTGNPKASSMHGRESVDLGFLAPNTTVDGGNLALP